MIIAALKSHHDYFRREERCVKSIRIRSHSGPHFPAFPHAPYLSYSVQMRENAGKCGPE